MYSPDGVLMSYISKKAAQWYLKKNLATQTKEDPLEIRLNFEPKSLGHQGNPFYLNPRRNQCVVCGSKEHLTRHHVVPRCYRKHFVTANIRANSHDIVALCLSCHEDYESEADVLKKQLEEKYNVYQPVMLSDKQKILLRAGSCAAALIAHSQNMPDQRREKLLNHIREFVGRDPSQQDLERIAQASFELKSRRNKGRYQRQLVVKALGEKTLEQIWREHFIKNAKPKYLPPHWSIDHKVRVK